MRISFKSFVRPSVSRCAYNSAIGFFALLLLSACSGMMEHRDGKALFAEGMHEEGLTKLEAAVKASPLDAEYRMALSTRRANYISQLLTSASNASRQGRLSEAEGTYQKVLRYDSRNIEAQQGIQALITERKQRLVLADAEALFKRNEISSTIEAQEKVRSVLVENPANKEALNLKSRISEARLLEQTPDSKLAEVFRKPISLEFRDASLRAVFDVVSKHSGLNFFFDKDVRPDLKTSVLAKNTTIEDAIRLLLTTNQLEQKVLNENTILVYPNTQQKQQDYQALSVRVFHLTNSDVKAVSNTLKTIVKTKDMVIDERLSLIIIRDTPEAIRMAERIIALQDLSEPEVMLDVEVLEVQRSKLLELGIQWPGQVALTPLPIPTGSPLTVDALRALSGSTTQVTVGNTLINARKQNAEGNILTNPRIRVRNKEKAKILIGDRVPVITTTSTSTGFVSESVNYVDVGLKLEVEPNIYLDEQVAIKIGLEVSNIVKEIVSKSGTLTYQIGTRNASTMLQLKDGETQILAGLISSDERTTANKIPFLGELPILGRLFGSQKDDSQRGEILLSITPHIVRSIRRPDLQMAEFDSGTANNIGAASLRLSRVAEAKDPKKEGAATAASASGGAPSAASAPVADPAASAATPATASASVAPPLPVVSIPPAVNALPGNAALAWQAPKQVKLGEQFTVVLKLTSDAALKGMPLLLNFDTQALQVVGIEEGDYFKQANGKSVFNKRIDANQGKIFITTIRQGVTDAEAGINGVGSVALVTFKAIKAGDQAKVGLSSATPDPALVKPIALPAELKINVLP